MVTEGDFTLSGEHIIQYTDNLLQNCKTETYINVLTNVTPVIKFKKKCKKIF